MATVVGERVRLRPPIAVLAAIATAWIAALVVEFSGNTRVFSHDALIESSWPLPAALLVFLLSWQVMIAAMMVPSALPMVGLFTTTSAAHPRPSAARSAFLGGYVVVWSIAGAIAFVGDVAVHRTVDSTPWLAERPWMIGGLLLAVAGGAQFLPLTKACLTSCRHPFAFLLSRYRPGTTRGFWLGFDHALFCVGCCWGLMLVMFAAGVANVLWMAVLTTVMVYEKAGRRGDRLARYVGVLLLAWAAIVLGVHILIPHAHMGGSI